MSENEETVVDGGVSALQLFLSVQLTLIAIGLGTGGLALIMYGFVPGSPESGSSLCAF